MSFSETNIEGTGENRKAFKELLLENLDPLYGFALSLARNKADAEDLVQETCLKAHKNWSQFQRGTNFKAWLFTILRSLFINQYRRKKKYSTDIMGFLQKEFSMYSAVEATKKELTISKEDILNPEKLEEYFGDEVVSALQELPDAYREVLFLCDVQELKYDEISQILEIPVGTVRSRLSRARSKLQKMLWDYVRGRKND